MKSYPYRTGTVPCMCRTLTFSQARPPRKDTSQNYTGFAKPMTFKEGVTYIEFMEFPTAQRVCVYRKLKAGEEASLSNDSETLAKKEVVG